MLTDEYLTDFSTVAKQWNYQKNGNIELTNVRAHSGAYAWWICEKGHEWNARISSRTRKIRPTGCPYCSGKKAICGVNDLATVYPEVVNEWNWELNKGRTPETFLPQSNVKVWWRCKNGHDYESTICNRMNGKKCPYCAGKKPIKGINDFETIYPEIAKSWDYGKNKKLPSEFLPVSNQSAFWKCDAGHSWERRICDRIKADCPYCSGKKAIKGVNDIVTLFPEVASRMMISENAGIELSEISPGSGKYVWNRCDKGHLYKAQVYNCTAGKGCSICRRGFDGKSGKWIK